MTFGGHHPILSILIFLFIWMGSVYINHKNKELTRSQATMTNCISAIALTAIHTTVQPGFPYFW